MSLSESGKNHRAYTISSAETQTCILVSGKDGFVFLGTVRADTPTDGFRQALTERTGITEYSVFRGNKREKGRGTL